MFRGLVLAVVLAGIGLHAEGQHAHDDTKASFSLLGSILLFGTYDEVAIATPGHVEGIRPGAEITANHGFFSYPSLSYKGGLITWGFFTKVEKTATGIRTRSALGVYSLANHKWKTFGDPDDTGSIDATSISSDNLHVAFVHEEDRKDNYKRDLRILNLNDGVIHGISHPSIWYRTTLSWSPDSKKIVLIINQVSREDPLVAVLNLQTGGIETLGEGIGAAWSPDGNWIAYYGASGEKCLLVHPDGTGTKVVARLHQSWFSSTRFGWGAPVWSPDGRHLLMTEMMGDLRTFGVAELDLENGRLRTIRRPALPIFGWARNGP